MSQTKHVSLKRQNVQVENKKLQKVIEEEEHSIEDKQLYHPDPNLYKHVKRAPHYKIKENEIFVTRNSAPKAQIKRVQDLLDGNVSKNVIIYGMGSQITRACDLVMQLRGIYGDKLVVAPQTDTVSLIDDFEPLTPDLEPFSQIRKNSSIKITLTLN